MMQLDGMPCTSKNILPILALQYSEQLSDLQFKKKKKKIEIKLAEPETLSFFFFYTTLMSSLSKPDIARDATPLGSLDCPGS